MSLNGTGKLTTQIGNRGASGMSVAVQANGKFVLAGSARVDLHDDFALARYNADGSLDSSFGDMGKVTTDFSRDEMGWSVAIQADGKIIVAGSVSAGGLPIRDFALARYNADGTLDKSFGGTGKVTTPIGSGDDAAFIVALQADGKVVVAGYSQNDFALARYDAGPPPPLANWRQTYYGTMLNYGHAADTATPDGDAIYNLLKYGLVIVPGTSGANAPPQGQRRTYADGQRPALVFTHDPARYDVTLEVQASDSPGGPWLTVASSILGATFSGSGFVSETPAGGGLNTVEVRDIVNLADAPLRFMRIQMRH